MDKPTYKLVGQPCGQHGQYTFHKALRVCGARESILAIGDFFFVKIWQDSELISIGELQLLWTDRMSEQTLVSLRLYFLPENTPDGRHAHGEHEVLAINERVVLHADDLLTWFSTGDDWSCGLRAVWGPASNEEVPAPLHASKLDFSDVDKEKAELEVDLDSPAVVVFSYPRYCRYRALVSRLEGLEEEWLKGSLVAALGGFNPPTRNTRILYCRDTFEYAELEGHEFVCNQLAPRARARAPRPRRRRNNTHLQSSRRLRNDSDVKSDSDSSVKDSTYYDKDSTTTNKDYSNDIKNSSTVIKNSPTPVKNSSTTVKDSSTIDTLGVVKKLKLSSAERAENKAFIKVLKSFNKMYQDNLKLPQSVRSIPLVGLYNAVARLGGWKHAEWSKVAESLPESPSAEYLAQVYQRYLLAYENYEKQNGVASKMATANGGSPTIITETISDDSPEREIKPIKTESQPTNQKQEDQQNQPITATLPNNDIQYFDPLNLRNLNTETGETEPTDLKLPVNEASVGVKPIGLLRDGCDTGTVNKDGVKDGFLDHFAQKYNLVNSASISGEPYFHTQHASATSATAIGGSNPDIQLTNGPADQRAAAKATPRSSLRSVRVKPSRESRHITSATSSDTSTASVPRPDSASSSPPAIIQATNLTTQPLNTPQPAPRTPTPQNDKQDQSDDEIVEVPYKPKTPEIIDLDEYPESPQNCKKKKLDILKERGLEVTTLPTEQVWNLNSLNSRLLGLNPTTPHALVTQAQLFQLYNMVPPYNGAEPPKIVQGKSIFNSSGIERTVYGNPKDPYMPPPHIIHGAPIKQPKNLQQGNVVDRPPKDILDLTCKTPSMKPAVEIVRVPTPKLSQAQNLTKNFTLLDGKAVVGSNLEITLVSPKQNTPVKPKVQKRSSNGQFVSLKTPTPPKDKPSTSGFKPKPNIIIPNYQVSRELQSPSHNPNPQSLQTAPGLLNAQNLQNVQSLQNAQNLQNVQSLVNAQNLQNLYKDASMSQFMEMQAKNMSNVPFMDPVYMGALYSSLAGQFDQRQLAFYRDLMANQFRNYSGLLNMGVSNTPTTKN